jgi:hypothetical protein
MMRVLNTVDDWDFDVWKLNQVAEVSTMVLLEYAQYDQR